MNKDVVCVGGTAVDRVYRLSNLPRPGSGAHIVEMAQMGGGVEANVAAALARLGARVGLVSRVGDDADGEWARDDLQAWGVDTTRVVTVPRGHTDFCLAWVPPDGERMLACHNPSLRNMRLENADRRYIAQARVLFLSGFVPPDLIEQAIHAAQAANLTVTFDLPDTFQDLAGRGLSRARFRQLLPQIDLLMTNHTGLTSLMALKAPEEALDAFQKLAPDMSLAMTMGAKGAWLYHDGQQVYLEAFPVQVLDTTGAGDAFHAGLIYGLLIEKWALRRAGLFASALAALNCTNLGARGGLVGRKEVERFLLERDLHAW